MAGGGYRGADFFISTKLSGTSTGSSRCGPISYSGGPRSEEELPDELIDPFDFVRKLIESKPMDSQADSNEEGALLDRRDLLSERKSLCAEAVSIDAEVVELE